MGMLFAAKCPNCWERYENCTCAERRGSDPISRCNQCGRFLNYCRCNEREKPMSFMPTMFKCEKCGLSARHCKCPDETESKPLGRITPIKAYQTTDGRKFVGEGAREDAEDHQRWLDAHRRRKEESPLKGLLKTLKRRKSGRKRKH